MSTITRPRGSNLLQWLRDALPTAAIVAALAGLAYWGHRNEWTLPKFSALIGQEAVDEDDWCGEHNVPASQCIECNKQLAPPLEDFGWCRVHGVAQCPLEHPEVAQLESTPTITPEDFERASRALALRPRAENNSLCQLHEHRIQFASVAAMRKVGVETAVVQQRPIVETIVANGELGYDETRSAHLASRVPGTVWRVEKQLGQQVRQGDVLALIDAAEVGKTKAELLQAIAQLRVRQAQVDRLRPLTDNGSVAGRQFREAEASLQEAQIRLLGAQQALVNLGFVVRAADLLKLDTEEMAERVRLLGVPAEIDLGSESTTSNLFPLRSPLDGIIVSRNVVAGEVVDTTTMLFGVADVSQMWLALAVRQDDARYLSLDLPVLFRASSNGDEPEIRGSLAWISTEADEQTRTVKVRVSLPNGDGRLRANTFGTGRIVLRDEPRAMVVPSEAVHWDGDCSVVFVRDKNFLKDESPKFFHVRKVRVGVKDRDATEIIVGLLPGEVIASKNSVVLVGQLLKATLGAGEG